MKYLAAIFDLDGLLLDTEALARLAWGKAIAEFGYVMTDELYVDLVGRDMRSREKILTQEFGSGFPFESIKTRRIVIGDEMEAARALPIKPGAVELLDKLTSLGIPVALATGTDRIRAERRISIAGLDKYFNSVITMEDVENGKPAPDIFLIAAKSLNILPHNCIVFEDSSVGVIAATSAGMKAYMVPDLETTFEQAKQSASRVVKSLFDLFDDVDRDFVG